MTGPEDDDYRRTFDLGFTEDSEAYARRMYARNQERQTAAFLSELTAADAAAGHLDRHVPTIRKETP